MLDPRDFVRCERLHCVLRRVVCIGRQRENEREAARRRGHPGAAWSLRRHDGKRGIAPIFISCHRCPEGRAIRAALGDGAAAGVRSGPRRGAFVEIAELRAAGRL